MERALSIRHESLSLLQPEMFAQFVVVRIATVPSWSRLCPYGDWRETRAPEIRNKSLRSGLSVGQTCPAPFNVPGIDGQAFGHQSPRGHSVGPIAAFQSRRVDRVREEYVPVHEGYSALTPAP